MSISAPDMRPPHATNVSVTADTLSVELSDGRTLAVPLTWYPRLLHASEVERTQWRLIGAGSGIHWPNIEEDLSVEGLLMGRPSQESQKSLTRWLESRQK